MVRDADWQKFEDYIAERLKEVDPYAKPTPGSRYGDINTNCGLHIECKAYNKKSVYNEDHMQKCIEELPLHSPKIPVLFTRNKDGKVRVHLDLEDFLNLYFEFLNLQNGV